MGFLAKLFGWPIDCPACGTRKARESFTGIHCPSEKCQHYDPNHARSLAMKSAPSFSRGDSSQTAWATQPPRVHYPNPLRVQYVNFQGEQKVFVADRNSVRRRHAHLMVAVEPTGREIALNPEKIVNRQEVESAVQ